MKFFEAPKRGERVVIDNVLYIAVPEGREHRCAGCAFRRDPLHDCFFPKQPHEARPSPGCAVDSVIFVTPEDAVTRKLVGDTK